MYEEVLLVGSYGDSIGRGEYEGIRVSQLKSLKLRAKNFGFFLKNECYELISKQLEKDIDFYHEKFREKKDYQQYELDFQLHYMRRMRNPCREMLNEALPTFQVFTSPKV